MANILSTLVYLVTFLVESKCYSVSHALSLTRRTQSCSTIGPATATPEKIRELVHAGMDVARPNFSHGSHTDHARAYSMIREASNEAGRAVGILADLQGPKIRLSRF